MKKIILVLPTLPNYRDFFLNDLSARLKENNMELVVLHGSTKKKMIKEIDNNKFKTLSFKTSEKTLKGFTVTTMKGLKQEVAESSPDCVVTLFNPANISLVSVLIYCIRKRIPYAIWSCGWIRPDLNKTLKSIREKFLSYFEKRATVHIAYHSMRKKYLVNKGIDENSVFIAQNTIDTETIMKSYDIEKVNVNRFKGKLKILFVGALTKSKHLKEAMNVVDTMITEKFQMSFTIIGGGDIFNELTVFRNTLVNKNEIHILGPKYGNDLKPFFLEHDVFLLTGSGGLAINEAMAYGLPVISTEGDGTGFDLIENNGYLLCEIGNEKEIKSTLSRFAKLSREEKLEMSENSLSIIKDKATNFLMVKNFMKSIFFMLNNYR